MGELVYPAMITLRCKLSGLNCVYRFNSCQLSCSVTAATHPADTSRPAPQSSPQTTHQPHPERVAEYEHLYQRYLAWGAAAEPLYNRGVPA